MDNRKLDKNAEAIIAAEGFVADVQFRIQSVLNDRGMTRAELASRLDVSEARVSQMFTAQASNLTLRTVGKVFYAMGEECYITTPRLEELLGPPARDIEEEGHEPGLLISAGSSDAGTVIQLYDRRGRPGSGYSNIRSQDLKGDAGVVLEDDDHWAFA